MERYQPEAADEDGPIVRVGSAGRTPSDRDLLADPARRATIRDPNGRSVLWGCVDSTGLGYRGTRAEDAAQASLIRQQNEVPGNRQSTLALAA
jgi:hypothetical protein